MKQWAKLVGRRIGSAAAAAGGSGAGAGAGLDFPAEAGLPLEGTRHYMVQVHYSNLNHLEGEKDASGFDLCTTSELRANDADIVAFGGMTFTVPAQGKLDLTCDLLLPKGTADLHVLNYTQLRLVGESLLRIRVEAERREV